MYTHYVCVHTEQLVIQLQIVWFVCCSSVFYLFCVQDLVTVKDFLLAQEFVPKGDWLHLDIAGVMATTENLPYLAKGMTGRPTRTLVEFISSLVKGSA